MFSYKKQSRKDKEYAIIQGDDSLSWNIEKVSFKFDNLFNGNKIMGKQKFFNKLENTFMYLCNKIQSFFRF